MGKGLRVVFASDDRPGYVGGVNAWLKRLFEGLAERGIECCAYFVAEPGPAATAAELEARGVRCRVIRDPDTESRVRRIVGFLGKDRPDVFVANHVVSALFAARWAREAGIPTVAAFHTDEDVYEALMDLCLGARPEYAVHAAVCVSRHIEREATRRARPSVRIERIPYGVDVPSTVGPPPDGPMRIVYSGRFVEMQKRIWRTLNALCEAVTEVPGTEAVVYGTGPEAARMSDRLAAYGSGFPVRLGGRVDSERMQEVLSQAHVIALLSDYEGLPVALLEAMACGVVPVCRPMRSGIDELVEHGVTGLLVEDSFDSFVGAVRRLKLDPALRARLSEGARARAAEFGRKRNEEAWENLLRSLAGEKSASARKPQICRAPELPPRDFRIYKDVRRSGSRYLPRMRTRLRVCMAYPNGSGTIESFVLAHLQGLPADVVGVWGRGFPLNVGSGRVSLLGTTLWLRAARWTAHRIKGAPTLWPYSEVFARFLKRERVDVVFADFGTTAAYLVEACSRAGIPLVSHFHGYDVYQRSTVEAHLSMYKKLFEHASTLVVPSDHMRGRLISLGAPTDRIRKIHCGVDRRVFGGMKPGEAGPHFLAIGRFVEKKGPILTLSAFRRVKEAVPDATLTMAGNGALLAQCIRLARSWGISESVRFPENVMHHAVPRLLGSARAFVQHSLTAADGDSEAVPVSVLEALSSGVPAVVTRHGGLEEAVQDGENGFLVDEEDVEGMASTMIQLARDPELAARLGSRAAAGFPARFEADACIRELHSVLEEAAAAGRGAR